MRTIAIYDTTLRDGAQGEGIHFSLSAKMRLAAALDRFGIDYVECGFPASNPADREFFARLPELGLKHARPVAFGSTRRPGSAPGRDAGLRALLESGAPAVAVFGKSWDLHVEHVLKVTRKENLSMIAGSVKHLAKHGLEVFYDAEHFFDGWLADPEYALATLDAALSAGASRIVLCDTNGGRLSTEIAAACMAVKERFPDAAFGIHTHDDCGLAVANALAAAVVGAGLVQGTVNGYGERAGNADLCSLLPCLALKMGYGLSCAPQLKDLRNLSRLVDEMADRRPDPRRPFVGDSAFAHKAGMHADAVAKDPATYEHVPPEAVGNRRRILVSELSGSGNVAVKTREMGLALRKDSRQVGDILDRLERLESGGYQFESADASFKLLVRKTLRKHVPFFELLGFNVVVQKRDAASPATTVATIKVSVGGQTELTAGEGDGPVDALNSALRKVLRRFYPSIDDVALEDYHVRILDPETGTRATTRVLIDSSDGKNHWGTVGVSENIIEASWEALVDSVEYKLILDAATPPPSAPPPAP